jgi:hypothetical protein
MSCVIEMGYRNTDGKGMTQTTSRPPHTVKDGVTTPSRTEKKIENWKKENKKRKEMVVIGKKTPLRRPVVGSIPRTVAPSDGS